jgi:KTSC domain-containing protein
MAKRNQRAAKARADVKRRKLAAQDRKFRTGVNSTCLRNVEHDGDSTLKVEFKRGSRYAYFDVPLSVAKRLAKASSVGKTYNRTVRNDYEYERLRAESSRRGGSKRKR